MAEASTHCLCAGAVPAVSPLLLASAPQVLMDAQVLAMACMTDLLSGDQRRRYTDLIDSPFMPTLRAPVPLSHVDRPKKLPTAPQVRRRAGWFEGGWVVCVKHNWDSCKASSHDWRQRHRLFGPCCSCRQLDLQCVFRALTNELCIKAVCVSVACSWLSCSAWLQGLVEGQAGLARTSVSGQPARRAPAVPNGVPSSRRAPPPPPK